MPAELSQVPASGQAVVPGAAMPQAAEDNDLIEPEWVAAVKKLMTDYHDDPYNLSQALTQLREDYLMKRYGRHIENAD